MTLSSNTFLAVILILVWLSVTAFSCQSIQVQKEHQSIEVKNEQLTIATDRLMANPQDTAALSQVVNMLRSDPSIVARANAASTLGTVAERHAASIKDVAVPALIEALDRDVGGVKDSAVRALVKFGPLPKDAIPVLRKSLEPSDTSVAWFSAEALGNMGEVAKDAVSDLVRVIEDTQATCIDDTAHICQYAVTALGKIGPAAKDAIPELGPLLNHKNPYLRARLAVAMIRIDPRNRDALGALEKLLRDHDVTVRRVTIWTLGDSGKDARPAKKLVRAALADSDESVRTAASSLLQKIDIR
jgi:HEAT repeat protein